jgi:hypothetical protein
VALHDDAGSRSLARAIGHVLTDLGIRALDTPDPQLLLVVSCGEPARAVFEEAHRHGVSHLPVVLDEDRVRVGPVVIPGVTPCMTCLDLHLTHAGRWFSSIVLLDFSMKFETISWRLRCSSWSALTSTS